MATLAARGIATNAASVPVSQAFVLRQRGDTGASTIGRSIARAESAMTRMRTTGMPGDFSFPYAFPRAGSYRIWVQFKRAGTVQTVAFDASVSAGAAAR